MKNELCNKRFKVEGKIFTVYAVAPSGVFAYEGDVMNVNENGDVVDPRYFDYEIVESNLLAAGRPSIGLTKKVSLTLPEEVWEKIENEKKEKKVSQAELFRRIIEQYFSSKISQ